MNFKIFKDFKVTLGFSSAILLQILGIVFAVKTNNYWGLFVIIGMIITFLSVRRVDKIYKENHAK